jgi:hypothetical protein
MEEKKSKYDESFVLRDLSKVGIKIRQSALTVDGSSVGLSSAKLIVLSRKHVVGIKRLGRIDFLLNYCKGYVGIIWEK